MHPNDFRAALEEKLKSISPTYPVKIDPGMTIFGDLGIYGQDMVELLNWAETQFGANLSDIDVGQMGPNETWMPLGEERDPGLFESFTVGDLLKRIRPAEGKGYISSL